MDWSELFNNGVKSTSGVTPDIRKQPHTSVEDHVIRQIQVWQCFITRCSYMYVHKVFYKRQFCLLHNNTGMQTGNPLLLNGLCRWSITWMRRDLRHTWPKSPRGGGGGGWEGVKWGFRRDVDNCLHFYHPKSYLFWVIHYFFLSYWCWKSDCNYNFFERGGGGGESVVTHTESESNLNSLWWTCWRMTLSKWAGNPSSCCFAMTSDLWASSKVKPVWPVLWHVHRGWL